MLDTLPVLAVERFGACLQLVPGTVADLNGVTYFHAADIV